MHSIHGPVCATQQSNVARITSLHGVYRYLKLKHRWSGTSTCISLFCPAMAAAAKGIDTCAVPRSPAICIWHRIARYRRRRLGCTFWPRLACGRGLPFAAPRNQQALLHDTIWGFLFFSFPLSNPWPVTKTDAARPSLVANTYGPPMGLPHPFEVDSPRHST